MMKQTSGYLRAQENPEVFFVSEKTLKTEKIADIMKILRLSDLKYRLREYDGKMSEKNGKQKNI